MGMFHDVLNAATREEDTRPGITREFTGDGTPFLKLPGLKFSEGPIHTITAVRVGTQPVPLLETRLHPSNRLPVRFTQPIEQETYVCRVAQDGDGNVILMDGSPVLLRAKTSNDGIWQNGHAIFVRADWTEENQDDVPAVAFTGSAQIESEIERRVTEALSATGQVAVRGEPTGNGVDAALSAAGIDPKSSAAKAVRVRN